MPPGNVIHFEGQLKNSTRGRILHVAQNCGERSQPKRLAICASRQVTFDIGQIDVARFGIGFVPVAKPLDPIQCVAIIVHAEPPAERAREKTKKRGWESWLHAFEQPQRRTEYDVSRAIRFHGEKYSRDFTRLGLAVEIA